MIDVVYKGRFTPEDRRRQLYRSFGFNVPEGVPGILVDVGYAKTATAALDVGLSDPSGFRGWSGSERHHVEIGNGVSTPGYLSGKIPSGRWNVEIGLHRIPDEGLEYEIRVRIAPVALTDHPAAEPPTRTTYRRDLPAEVGNDWLVGDLGVHTYHSNGADTVEGLASRAIGDDLDFVVVADFNTISQFPDIDRLKGWPVTLVPAETIAIDTGHTQIIGSPNWVDLREAPVVWAKTTRDAGAILSACYPTRADSPWKVPIGGRPDLFEVWTGPRRTIDPTVIEWWRQIGPEVTPVSSSGWTGGNDSKQLGRPVTWVEAKDGDVLEGLRAGRTAVSGSVEGPLILRSNEEIVALRASGYRLVDWDGTEVALTADLQHVPANNLPYFLRNPRNEIVAVCK